MSSFDRWITEQDKVRDWDDITPTDQMRLAWNAAIKHAELEISRERRSYEEQLGVAERVLEQMYARAAHVAKLQAKLDATKKKP